MGSAPSSASWSPSRASSPSSPSSRSRPSSPSRPSRPRRRRRPLVCIAGLACASKVEVRTVLSVCAKRRFARRYVLQGLSLEDVYVVRRISCARVFPSVPLVGAKKTRRHSMSLACTLYECVHFTSFPCVLWAPVLSCSCRTVLHAKILRRFRVYVPSSLELVVLKYTALPFPSKWEGRCS